MKDTAADKIARAVRIFAEIIKRAVNGTLDFDEVNTALQRIVEGRFSNPTSAPKPPRAKSGNWTMSPSSQISRLLDLSKANGWGVARSDIPEKPKGFKPATPTEVLLLAFYFEGEDGLSSELITLRRWWDAFPVSNSYIKWMWQDMHIDGEHMQLVSPAHKPGIRWVAYDPCANWHQISGRQINDLWGNPLVAPTLASTESVMALCYDPHWALRWNLAQVPYPDLSGWKYSKGGEVAWQNVPYLCRWGADGQVELSVSDGGDQDPRWSSPTVRELL